MAREGWRTKNRRSTMPLERLMPLADCSTVTGANTERNIQSGICDDANVAVISMQSTVDIEEVPENPQLGPKL